MFNTDVKSNEQLQTCPICGSDQYGDGFCGNCFKQIVVKSDIPYEYKPKPTEPKPK